MRTFDDFDDCFREWIECWDCGGAEFVGHDCGEDCCACLYPEDNLECQTCNGRGGWYRDQETA